MKLQLVRIGDIKITGDNMREDPGDLRELSDSIKRYGILQPLVVYTMGKKYGLIAGHRRLAAGRRAGLLEVPVVVRDDLSEEERLSLMIVENVQRKHLTPLEEAHAFEKLVKNGMEQKRLAQLIDKSEAYVSNRVKLLTLDEETQQKVHKGLMGLQRALGYKKRERTETREGRPRDSAQRWQEFYMDKIITWLETGRVNLRNEGISERLIQLRNALAAVAAKSAPPRAVSDLPMCDGCGTFVGPFFACKEGSETYCETCLTKTHVLARREVAV